MSNHFISSNSVPPGGLLDERMLVSLFLISIPLISTIAADLTQCTCDSYLPCVEEKKIPKNFNECMDHCREKHSGRIPPEYTKCLKQYAAEFTNIIACLHEEVGVGCTNDENHIIIQGNFTKFRTNIRQLIGVQAKGEDKVVVFKNKEVNYVNRCILRCFYPARNTCSLGLGCGLLMPDEDDMVKALEKCGDNHGIGVQERRHLARCIDKLIDHSYDKPARPQRRRTTTTTRPRRVKSHREEEEETEEAVDAATQITEETDDSSLVEEKSGFTSVDEKEVEEKASSEEKMEDEKEEEEKPKRRRPSHRRAKARKETEVEQEPEEEEEKPRRRSRPSQRRTLSEGAQSEISEGLGIGKNRRPAQQRRQQNRRRQEEEESETASERHSIEEGGDIFNP